MNELGQRKIPFLFVLDFDLKKPLVVPLSDIDSNECLYNVNGNSNYNPELTVKKLQHFDFEAVSKERYAEAFEIVQKHIHHGDSFLLNLTMPSKITTNLSLKDIFFLQKLSSNYG